MRALVLAGLFGCTLCAVRTAPAIDGGSLNATLSQDEGDRGDEAADPAADSDPAVVRARIERLIGLATEGRAVVRPQAAQRLLEYGPDAVELLRERVGVDGEGLAGLGPDLVQVIAEFGDPELRKRLWWELAEPNFPWRPQAARSLAATAQLEERERFQRLADDRLGQVRAAAIEALGKLGPESTAADQVALTVQLLRGKLVDTDELARRAAAAALSSWGDTSAPFWLLEELRRDDLFFDLRTGERARFAAATLLREKLGDLEGFDAAHDPGQLDNRLAWRKLEDRLTKSNHGVRPELPEIARAASSRIEAVFGLELRSCRQGDMFLRFTANDELFVGTGRAARVQLPQGTTNKLLVGIRDRLRQLDEERFWGTPGCDTEQLFLHPPGAPRTTGYLVSKSADSIENLRPAPLTDIARAILAVLPDGADADDRLDHLRTQTRATFDAIGGGLE